MATTNPTINVLACSAAELTSFLMEHRFDNDGVATTAFLLEGTSTLPNADEIAAQLMGGSGEDNDEEEEETSSPSKRKEVVALVSSHSEEMESKSPAAPVSQQNANNNNNNNNLGAPLHTTPVELSLTNPRGKFHITFHQEGVHASTIKNPQTLVIPKGAIRNVIVFPKPTDCQFISSSSKKAAISPMVLLCFHDNDDDDNDEQPSVTFEDKPLSQICFSLPATLDETLNTALEHASASSANSSHVEDAWIQLLSHSLQIPTTQIFRIANPNTSSEPKLKGSWTFKSYQEANTSSTAGNLPFVKTYYGVQDGCLFPMEQGLLFFKYVLASVLLLLQFCVMEWMLNTHSPTHSSIFDRPPLFIPRSKLHSIACGRGNGSSSRYVDMNITLDDDTALEFTNISREELSVLNHYIHNILIPAMQRDQAGVVQDDSHQHHDNEDSDAVVVTAVAKAEDGDRNSDQESDDSVQVIKVEGSRGRSKRKAAREAIQQTKQHYHAINNDEDEEDEEDSDEDEAFEAANVHMGEQSSDEEDDDDDDDDAVEVVGTSKRGKGKQCDVDSDEDEEEEDDDDDDDDVVQVEIAETDTEEDDDDDDEETSPPSSKKHRSK